MRRIKKGDIFRSRHTGIEWKVKKVNDDGKVLLIHGNEDNSFKMRVSKSLLERYFDCRV
jgi:hypothetical protein